MSARAYRLPGGEWVCELNAMVIYKGSANKADDTAKAINNCLARGCEFVAERFSLKPGDKKAWHVIPRSAEYGIGDPIRSFGNSGNKADDFASELMEAVKRGLPQPSGYVQGKPNTPVDEMAGMPAVPGPDSIPQPGDTQYGAV